MRRKIEIKKKKMKEQLMLKFDTKQFYYYNLIAKQLRIDFYFLFYDNNA